MSFMLTRLCAYFTLLMYLVVGVVAVRVLAPDMATVEISSSYLEYFSPAKFEFSEAEKLVAPEMTFAEVKIPENKPKTPNKKADLKIVIAKKKAMREILEKVSKFELPFQETIVLKPLMTNYAFITDHVALYREINDVEKIAKSEMKQDEISTKQSAEAEPEFFEYPQVAEEKSGSTPASSSTQEQPTEEKVADVEKNSTNKQTEQIVNETSNVEKPAEEIAIEDLLAFDYSQAGKDLKEDKIPVITKLTTQARSVQQGNIAPVVATQKIFSKKSANVVTTQEKNAFVDNLQNYIKREEETKSFSNRVTIQITGTNLKRTNTEVGFEVRPQDDLRDAYSDYNTGEVNLDNELSRPKMTRAVTILKRGYVPTNTDLILEDGSSEITVPLIEENTFNELMAPFGSRGSIGSVLVELEENVDSASLDVPYSKVVKLDENMMITQDSNFSYQLFVGVKSGNALLSYKADDGEVTSKIIHVHEHELTFETNFFEPVDNEKFTLLEEDLLSKDKTPLIISGEEIKQFATDKTVKKINRHTYRSDFSKTLLGGRKYLELGHQAEPIFVGFKEANNLEIPSENFMRYILSKFEGSKLGNRCLVQINLTKNAVSYDVAPESVDGSLQISSQILDADGKFYDSLGEKSQKIIIVGENQGSSEYTQDARINLKLTYHDGSVHYLSSYCSPNTYLVEQL